MERIAWNLTFVPRKGDTIPIAQRVRALLKFAGRYCGLRSVADIPLRKQVIEECCAVLCVDCAQHHPLRRDSTGIFWHPRQGTLCDARALREGLEAKASVNGGNDLPAVLTEADQDCRDTGRPPCE